VSVNGVDSRWSDHNKIADIISQSGELPLALVLVSVLGTFELQARILIFCKKKFLVEYSAIFVVVGHLFLNILKL